MKKIVSIILVVGLLLSFSVVFASAEEFSPEFELHADSIIVANLENNDVYYSKNADTKRQIGSITKIMTYIVVNDNVADFDNTMVEIKQQPLDEIKGTGYSSAGFEEYVGKSFSVYDLLCGMMIPSGCDAAQELAYFVGGTTENFVKMMNEKAQSLGCNDTLFTNPTGLDTEDYYTTANDLLKIVKYAYTCKKFTEITSTEYGTALCDTYPWINTNKLVNEVNGNRYYYRYATGAKTGTTDTAKKCIVATAEKGKDKIVCIALGAGNNPDSDLNFVQMDAKNLLSWAFDNFTENINVELERRYCSLDIGKTLQLSNIVKSDGLFTFKSSDESVASVDENGLVTAKKFGQAKISMYSTTGNFDYCYVSVGFYNGVYVNSNFRSYAGEEVTSVDFKSLRKMGIDYSVIRAGYTDDDGLTLDSEFLTNIKNAADASMPISLSYVSYAEKIGDGATEAENVASIINDTISGYKDKIKLPILFDMSVHGFSSQDEETNTKIAIEFAEKIRELTGLDTIVYASKNEFSKINAKKLIENEIYIYFGRYPYIIEYDKIPLVRDESYPNMLEYRSDGYIPYALRYITYDSGYREFYGTRQNLMYMPSVINGLFDKLQPTVDGENTNKATFKISNDKYVAKAYEIYEKAEGEGEYTLAQTLCGSKKEAVFKYDEGKKHSYRMTVILEDILNPENTVKTTCEPCEEIYIYGRYDVDRDKSTSIVDATYIQRILVKLIEAPVDFDDYGDVDGDGVVTVIDATIIQKYLAKFEVE